MNSRRERERERERERVHNGNLEGDRGPMAGGGDDPAHHAGWSSPANTAGGPCSLVVPAEPDGLLQGFQRQRPRTQKYKPNTPMAMIITAFKDNSFDFIVKSPSVTWYLKKAAGIESGSSRPGHVVASSITLRHVYKIAKVKQIDPYCQYVPLESICKSIIGTANTTGIQAVKDH